MTSIDILQTTPTRPASLLRRALNRRAQRKALLRQAQKLRTMPDERLDDMGITREQVEGLF
ncbi:MAG: hypothetical protein R3D59_06890 [Paracoccaceae bacterium]